MGAITENMSALLDQVRDNVSRLRGQIDDLKVRRQTIFAAFVPLEVAEARLDAIIADRASVFDHNAHYLALAEQPRSADILAPDNLNPGSRDWVFWLFPDQIKARYLAALREHYEGETNIKTAAERKRAVAEIDQLILNAEIDEEAIISEAQQAGLAVSRRPGANPAVLLGLVDAKR